MEELAWKRQDPLGTVPCDPLRSLCHHLASLNIFLLENQESRKRALRSLVLVRLMNRIHFVGYPCLRTSTCDARRCSRWTTSRLNRYSDTNLDSVSPDRRAGMEKTGTRKNRFPWCSSDVISPYSPESARSGGPERIGERRPRRAGSFPVSFWRDSRQETDWFPAGTGASPRTPASAGVRPGKPRSPPRKKSPVDRIFQPCRSTTNEIFTTERYSTILSSFTFAVHSFR